MWCVIAQARRGSCPPSPSIGISSTVAGWQFVVREECAALSYFAFTRPGECSIHATHHDTSPDALRSPTHQNPLRPGLLMHTFTCVIRVLPFSGVHRSEAAATQSRRQLAASRRVLLPLRPQVARLARSARRSGCVGRCSPRTRLCESRPRARSLATRSAAHWPCWLPRPRSGLPGSQARPPSLCREPSAVCHARPCDRARPAWRQGCDAWRGRLLEGSRCYFRARRDRASGSTLSGRHEGSLPPSLGGDGHAVGLGRGGGAGVGSSDFHSRTVNVRVHSCV
jgi:hypothetical protein